MRVFRNMKRRAIVMLIVCMTTSGWPLAYAQERQTDANGHWAEARLSSWVSKGYVQGYEDGSLRPDEAVKRGELVALINRASGATEKTDIRFRDLASGHWAYDEVAKAAKAGYVDGYEDGTVRVEAGVSRQELAVMLVRLLKLGDAEADRGLTTFKDAASFPAWSRMAIGALAASGIVDGYEDGTYRPAGPVTRAEAVVMLDRALNGSIYRNAGVFGPRTGTETVKGNVTVTASGVTLQNMSIEGDLVLAEAIGEGDVDLKNVTVSGTTRIYGGGPNSIRFDDSVIAQVVVDKRNGLVRIKASGATAIREAVVRSGAIIEADEATGNGVDTVTLSEPLPKDAKVTLVGRYADVNVRASNVLVEIPKGTVSTMTVAGGARETTIVVGKEAALSRLVLNAAASVFGQGEVKLAVVYSPGVRFEKAPAKIEAGSGIGKNDTIVIGDRTIPIESAEKASLPSAGNGGGMPPTDPDDGGGTPPTNPGNGGGTPPTDPDDGGGTPPTNPGNGGGTPPTNPGNGGGTPPTDPATGAPQVTLLTDGTVTESVYVGGQRIATVGDFVYAVSDQAGTIYLVPGATTRYITMLDSIVEQSKGIRKQAAAGEKAILSTAGLPAGDYVVIGLNDKFAMSEYEPEQELRLNAAPDAPLAQNTLYVYSNSRTVDIGFNKPIRSGFASADALKSAVSYAVYGESVTSSTYAVDDAIEIRGSLLRIAFANAPAGKTKVYIPANALQDSSGAPLPAPVTVEFDFGPSLTVKAGNSVQAGQTIAVVTDKAADVYLVRRGLSATKGDLEQAVQKGTAKKASMAANAEAILSTAGLPPGEYSIIAWGGGSAPILIRD
ncbi:S-layer homology domain-containing protein [Paenibacillus sp. GYB003]|uniref:S-layer homology domain-containing protein n=1 Tax=Paenibacillus sp. GYB003 TaxID=2994392 RepID=UPI002F966A60